MKQRTTVFLIIIVPAAFAIAFVAFVRVTITGNYEGLFLLKGQEGYLYELKDDLYLNEERRYIFGLDFGHEKQAIYSFLQTGTLHEPLLYFEWNDKKGNGFVRNYLPGGKQLLTNFSRFIDDGGKEASGLFVGGGLPANVRGDDMTKKNETGMAFYDGARWLHIWCNVNEAMFSMKAFEPVYPSSWKFLGSRVLTHDETDLILESSHEVMIDYVPLHIDRYAAFRAGDAYFILSIVVSNRGNMPVTYSYQYGDEPWLGDYGTSAGNVGWAADGLHKYSGRIDSMKNTFAGYFDYGNDAAGESHAFTMSANFIEWFGKEKPSVYFSNAHYDVPAAGHGRVPLSSNTRFINLQWGPRTLQPGESATYTLAIGMADHDPTTGFPRKPTIDLKNFP